jgi:hypothetical protein
VEQEITFNIINNKFMETPFFGCKVFVNISLTAYFDLNSMSILYLDTQQLKNKNKYQLK